MSHPPDYPGRQRLKRVSSRAGSDAYQGALEAVGAVLIACGFGYWFDRSWDTRPWGLIVGIGIGFAAMVLRLLRLGQELNFDEPFARKENLESGAHDDDLGIGHSPGMSDALREEHDDEAQSETKQRNNDGTRAG